MYSGLVVPFVVQMVFLAPLIAALSYFAGRSAVEEFLDKRMQDLVDSAEQNIRAQVDKSDLLARALSHGATTYGVGFSDPVATESLLFGLTAMTPFANFIYVGGANGDFIGVDRLPDRTVVYVKNQGTGGKKLVYIARQAGERGQVIPEMSTTYDTLALSWYKLATEKKARTWTSVYLSFSKNILEVTKAVPVVDTKTADRLKSNAREQDTVARMGGDEFVLVWPNLASAEQTVALAKKILTALIKPAELANGSIVIRV
ncbi:MAG: diguanylate cyclase [Burkholderiales bacterium]